MLCPKCQARNDPTLARCSACAADLLPGRSRGDRLGTLVAGIVLAAAIMALAVFMASRRAEVPLCASPLSLGAFALVLFFGALRYGLGRTLPYEKYLNRAERHLESAPEQALTDFTTALELAPDRIKTRILKQRGELLSRLGRTEQALADLSAHAAAPEEGGAATLLSGVSEIDIKPSTDQATLDEINRLEKQLVESGARQWIGYCQACRAAVNVDVNRRCARCGAPLAKTQLVRPEESEGALAKLDHEQARRRRKRLLTTGVAVVALLLCVVLPLAAALPGLIQEARKQAAHGGSLVGATPTRRAATTSSAPVLFRQNVFAFSYPGDWWEITPAEVGVLLNTSLKGMKASQYSYIGGVFNEGLDNCKGCAQIVLVVATDPALTGTLTDEQYQDIRAASQKSMGARLLSHNKITLAGMPAVESIHLGLSGRSKLWEYIIVPPQPGVAYLLSCSSHPDSFTQFEPAFRQAVNTLRIGEALPTAVPTLTPRSIRTGLPAPTVRPVARTYKVQPGDTLSQIAKELGVTLEALAEANGLQDPYIIQPGQVLTVPVGAR